MVDNLPFPEGHKPQRDAVIVLKGITDKSLKGKKVIIKAPDEEDIREIRAMLLKEVKRQNEESNARFETAETMAIEDGSIEYDKDK